MSEELQDLERTCKDCKQPFTITKGEQEHLLGVFGSDYKPPVRCKPCRTARKNANANKDG